MKVVGIRKCDFVAKDKTEVKGYNIFVEEEITFNGKGVQTDKYFFSEARIEKMNLDLDTLLGRNVIVSYNKWGKIERIIVQD